MLHNYKFTGFVLKRTNYGENDKLLTVFTKSFGKIVLLARGIRKIHSRKAPHLEPFNLVTGYAAYGKFLDIVIEANTIKTYSCIKKDLRAIAYAYRVVEMVNAVCGEKQDIPVIFDLLSQCFDELDNEITAPYIPVKKFSLKFLWEMGYLQSGKLLEDDELKIFLESVMERSMKSDTLLTRLQRQVV